MGTTMVIVSEETIANDLLSLRGAIYSDRPNMIMGDLVTGHKNLVCNSANDYWRRGRKFAQAMLTSEGVQRWIPSQTFEARRMVAALAKDPANYRYWFERASSIVSLEQIYGKRVDSEEDEVNHVRSITTIMHTIERVGSPNAYLVDFIPALALLPAFLAPFKREAQKLFDFQYSYLRALLDEQQEKYDRHIPEEPPSFCRSLVQNEQHWGLSRFESTFLLGVIYGGGSGTTSLSMQSYCLAMCHYPEWQGKVQREIEGIVGSERMPNADDIPRLPTVRAIAKEVLRWRPVVTGGLPHRLRQDDIYKGYFIPEGAIVHPNQWAIHQDPNLYPDPTTFRPERWLDPMFPTFREPLTKYPNLKRFSAFGFGRRICPGLESAENALYLQLSTLAWTCSIRRKKDANGDDMPVPWYDYEAGANSGPKPFPFDVEPVSSDRIQILVEALRKGSN